MGRPKEGALSSFASQISDQIKDMRSKQEGWGPTTLLVELKKKYGDGLPLPSRSSIGRYLQAHQLSSSYEPNLDLPVSPCKRAKRAHSLWQVDGQGNEYVEGIGPIAMLNIKDIGSSVYVACLPAQMKSMQGHPNTRDYQMAMRLGFMHHGRPRRVQSDHASVFYDNHSKSPFPTTFCLWLISLGIEPCFSRVHRPTDQGEVERMHQTVFNQVLKGRTDYKSWEHLFQWCEQRRHRLNYDIPSSATDGLAPLKKYPKAKHSGRHYHPHLESHLIDMKKVYAFLAKCKWYRRLATNRTICLGGMVYYVPNTKPKEQLFITFCNETKSLVFQNDKELVVASIPIKGISAAQLMGDLEQFAHIPNLQLKLPFDWEHLKINTTLRDST